MAYFIVSKENALYFGKGANFFLLSLGQYSKRDLTVIEWSE